MQASRFYRWKGRLSLWSYCKLSVQWYVFLQRGRVLSYLTLPDTIQSPILLNPGGGSSSPSPSPYNFSSTGIAWPGEAKKYVSKPNYNLADIVPPPNWMKRFPNGYTNATPPPDLRADEHFQNWMRTAGLPTFSKLWGRNDTQDMPQGRYNISIEMSESWLCNMLDLYLINGGIDFPVTEFGGTKSLVISTITWSGGKNAFLGWAYIGASVLFVLLAIVGTGRHLLKPRCVKLVPF